MVVSDRVLMGPGPVQSLPRSHGRAGPTPARPPRSRVPGSCSTRLASDCARYGVRRIRSPSPYRVRGRRAWRRPSSIRSDRATWSSIGVNGLFGERMCDVAQSLWRRGGPRRRAVGTATRSRRPAGRPSGTPKMIALVHAETSTGVRNDVAAVAAGKGDALLLGGLRDVPRWDPGRRRRLGRGPRVQRDAEVPGRSARPGPLHPEPAGLGTPHPHPPELVPRPGHDRRLHVGPGPQVPPHRTRWP